MESNTRIFIVQILIGNLSADAGELCVTEIIQWAPKAFEAETQYSLNQQGADSVITAKGVGSASGLFAETKIDLTETPILSWSWRGMTSLAGLDERTKQGDDYVARVYVVAKHPYLFWKSRALNYVWSSNQQQDSHWPNAFTSRAMMVAVAGSSAPLGVWRQERRNVREDFLHYFGESVTQVDVIAIMSDGDKSNRIVDAEYGCISFGQQ